MAFAVKSVRTIKRRPIEERWKLDALNNFRGLPWRFKAGVENEPRDAITYGPAAPALPAMGGQPAAQAVGDIYSRAFKIFRADLEEHGYTAGCPGCIAVRDGIGYRSHKEECRVRIRNELLKTDAGRLRIETAESRPVKRVREKQRETERERERDTG